MRLRVSLMPGRASPSARSSAYRRASERTLKLGAGNRRAVPAVRDRLCRACRRPGRAVPRPARGPGGAGRGTRRRHDDVGALAACRGAAPARGRRRPRPRRWRPRPVPSGPAAVRTWPRLALGRLAAARGEWTAAQEHALAHLDACVEGGHATYVPGCLDALAEVAAGLGADEDAVRLFAAAERARAEIGTVRVPPEGDHWAAIDEKLRDGLGDDAYAAARAQGAELSTDDALEWARRARGPRRRPAGGWDSLTPTEARVVRVGRRRPHQPADRRADVHLEGDGQDTPRPHL